MTASSALATADWRRRVFGLYDDVRERAVSESPEASHALWRRGRDELFRRHPASALNEDAKPTFGGLAVAPYDPAFRFEALVDAEGAGEVMEVPTGTDGVVRFERLGSLTLQGLGTLALWRLSSYGGGLFLPLHDGTAGATDGS